MNRDTDVEKCYGSRDTAIAALNMAMTQSRAEEKELQIKYAESGILAAAVDYGGEFTASVKKIVERAVVSSKREGVIKDNYNEEGAVAGAAREALTQIMPKAFGLNIGGKIGIARCKNHISVAIFLGIGLLHLNEVAVGLGHRVV